MRISSGCRTLISISFFIRVLSWDLRVERQGTRDQRGRSGAPGTRLVGRRTVVRRFGRRFRSGGEVGHEAFVLGGLVQKFQIGPLEDGALVDEVRQAQN